MASKAGPKSRRDLQSLKAGEVWKGENESDPELMDSSYTNPLSDAGVWTEDEAYQIYREELVRLRDLYVGQLGHMKHVLQEKRREFLLQWQHEEGTFLQAAQPSRTGSLEDSAYRCYRKRSGEEALLERKQKQRRISSSLDFFCKRDTREMNKPHYQYLLKLHQQLTPTINPLCTSNGCENQCLPFATGCSRHICDDQKQLFYTRCSYTYPSGVQCSNPLPLYMVPPLCGGHCDNISLASTVNDEPNCMEEISIESIDQHAIASDRQSYMNSSQTNTSTRINSTSSQTGIVGHVMTDINADNIQR